MEHFFGIEGASKDPRFQFVNNPMWFNWIQLMQQQQQLDQQAQQQQAEAQAQQAQQQQQQQEAQGDLSRSVDQLSGLLTKSEQQLPSSRRLLLQQERKILQNVLESLEADAERATRDIVATAAHHLPLDLKE